MTPDGTGSTAKDTPPNSSASTPAHLASTAAKAPNTYASIAAGGFESANSVSGDVTHLNAASTPSTAVLTDGAPLGRSANHNPSADALIAQLGQAGGIDMVNMQQAGKLPEAERERFLKAFEDAIKAKQTLPEEDEDQPEEASKLHLFPEAFALKEAARDNNDAHHRRHRHGLLKDWKMFRRLRRAERVARAAARSARRAEEAAEKARKAERAARKAENAAKDAHGTEHTVKAAETARRAERESVTAAKEAARLKHIADAARMEVRFAHMYSVVSLIGKGGAIGFGLKRVLEAMAAYATADPNESRKEAVDEAMGTLIRSPFSQEATAAFKQGHVIDGAGIALRDTWHAAVDTAKFVGHGVDMAVNRPQEVLEEGQKAWNEISWLYALYQKDPKEAQVITRRTLEDMEGVAHSADKDITAVAHAGLTGHKPNLEDSPVQNVLRAGEDKAIHDRQLVNAATNVASDGLAMPLPPSPSRGRKQPDPEPVRHAPGLPGTAGQPQPTE